MLNLDQLIQKAILTNLHYSKWWVINYNKKVPCGHAAGSDNSVCAVKRADLRTEHIFRDCRWLLMLFILVRPVLLNVCSSLHTLLATRAKRPQPAHMHVPVISALTVPDPRTVQREAHDLWGVLYHRHLSATCSLMYWLPPFRVAKLQEFSKLETCQWK